MDVFWGAGNGSFAPRVTYAVGSFPTGLTSGDVNGDGVADLVSSNFSSSNLSVFYGTGNGSFTFGLTYSCGANPKETFAVDLNGDGKTDLAIANINSMQIALGTGAGFAAPVSYADSTFLQGITGADFNGDNIVDLVTSDGPGGSLGVFIGRGDGTFASRVSYGTGTNPGQIITADFNGDGISDIANASGNALSVLIGVGNGTFSPAVSYAQGINVAFITTGDFNGDGVFDLAAANYTSAAINIYTGGTKEGVGPLLPFSLKTMADARQALPVFKRKREQLAAQRGEIGAFQSRISVAVNVLQASSENFEAAESRIRDADVANESANLVRHGILQQTASSVLAQANQQPRIAIQLLGTI